MSQEQLDNSLHLPSLSIKGFRGIDALTIDRLGRVTLIAGKNSVGKTTILDAIQVYAARGHYNILSQLLTSRQEVSIATVESVHDRRRFVPDFPALFHGRDVSKCARIAIGPKRDTDQLRIEESLLSEDDLVSELEEYLRIDVSRGYTQTFRVVFQDEEQMLPWILPVQGSDAARTVERYSVSACLYLHQLLVKAKWSPPIGCQFLGPGLLSDDEIVRFWNAIALTEDEDRAVQALRLIFGNDLERVAVRRDEISDTEHDVQRVVARLRGQARPVPLQSLGDGALHLSGVALALTNSRDGFLLIDEAENGIHHSVQRDYWRMVFETAQANNVQVLATTHSFDCLRGFAQAMTDCEDIDGALVRLERENGTLRAVGYSERNIKAAAKQRIDIEMR